MHEIDFKSKDYDVFAMFNDRWALATAGSMADHNTLTISWGSLGILWGRPIVTVYVTPARYSFEYLQNNDCFTVSFFPQAYHTDLAYLGSHSGRDGNKIAQTSLTPVAVGESVGFEQAELTFLCKKIYSDPFALTRTPEDMQQNLYQHVPAHHYFIGEIIRVLEN